MEKGSASGPATNVYCSRVLRCSVFFLVFAVLAATMSAAQASQSPPAVIQGMNALSLSSATQVFLRLDRKADFQTGMLGNPPRVYFDLKNARIGAGVGKEITVDDSLLSRVRLAQLQENLVRIVLDIKPEVRFEHSVESEPPRMLIEVRPRIPKVDFTPEPQSMEHKPRSEGSASTLSSRLNRPESARSLASQESQDSASAEARPRQKSQAPLSRKTSSASTSSLTRIENIYFSSEEDHTEVLIDLESPVVFSRGKLKNPSRLYFDLQESRLLPPFKRQIAVGNEHLKRVRVAQNTKEIVRVVLDLESDVIHRVEVETDPPRLVVAVVAPGKRFPSRPDPAPRTVAEVRPQQTRELVRPAGGLGPEPSERPTSTKQIAPISEELAEADPLPYPPRPPIPELPSGASAPPMSTEKASARPTLDSSEDSSKAESSVREGLPIEKPPALVLTTVSGNNLEIPYTQQPPLLGDFVAGIVPRSSIEVTGFRQRTPGDGVPASEETTAYLSYDDRNIYIIFDCKDDPAEIRSQMSKREQISRDDIVSLYLDTFRDFRRAYLFQTNPFGIQRDGILAEGQSTDYQFDTLWYSKGRLTNDGYVVWMAIPFKSLRFSSNANQTWGIALGRSIRRKQESSYWPHISRRVEGFVQQMAEARGLSNISPGRNIEVIPYTTYTNSRHLEEVSEERLGYLNEDEYRGGIDAKAIFRDSLTLDMTVNPDFSQVESDEPQVTVNQRFEVLFPEKRPFFLENADFFQTPERLFFSRRIVDPQVGARLTGKVGDWRMGFLTTDDRAPGEGLSEEDVNSGRRAGNAVIRLQRDFGNQSNVGVLFTSRDFADTYNRVFAFDTRLKLNPNWFFTGQMAGSTTRSSSGDKLSDPSFFAQLSHSGRHSNFFVNYLDRAPEFRSALGFIPRVDIRQTEASYQYLWYPESSILLDFGPSISAMANWDRRGILQDWFVNGAFQVDLMGPSTLSFNQFEAYTLFQELDFRYGRSDLSFITGFLNWLEFSLTYGTGTDINYSPAPGLPPYLARSRDASLYLGARPGSRLSIDGTYIYTALRSLENELPIGTVQTLAIFNNHLVRWRTNYQFTRELSLRAILDYSSIIPNESLIDLERDKFLTFDILLTYLLNPGTALYLGYTNRYRNIDLDPTDPYGYRRISSPTTPTSRQFFVKLSHLFRF